MSEDQDRIDHLQHRLAVAAACEEQLARTRRYAEAMTLSPNPLLQKIATEILDIVGTPT